jgi:hypothetical protein
MRHKRVREDRGSASVLVIMLMLMLITFGVLAMMSAYSNYKISKRNAEWTQTYYQLESDASDVLSKVDTAIKEAVRETILSEAEGEHRMRVFLSFFSDEVTALSVEGELTPDPDQFFDETGSVSAPVFRYTVQNDAGRTFYVSLLLLPFAADGEALYEITAWQEVPIAFDFSEALEYNDPGGVINP